MGAISFSIDSSLIEFFKQCLPLQVFVETGTFEGAAITVALDHFQSIYSIELSPEYYQYAVDKFCSIDKVKLFQGDSSKVLHDIMPKMQQRSALYWLDAHWCVAKDAAGRSSQCPLLAEIAAIQSLNDSSVIVIDDARLFLAPPLAPHEVAQWPSFTHVVNALMKLSTRHNLLVLNDTILFFPIQIEQKLIHFAQQHGVDWLSIAEKSRDYNSLCQQLSEKETEIKQLAEACQARADLIDKLSKKAKLFAQLTENATRCSAKKLV